MPYLHEQRLAEARKRLYMLGNTKHRDQTSYKLGGEMGQGVGALFGAPMGQANDLKKRQEAAAKAKLEEGRGADEYTMMHAPAWTPNTEADDVNFIKGNKDDSPAPNPLRFDPMNPHVGMYPMDYQGPAHMWTPEAGIAEADKHDAANNISFGGYEHPTTTQERMNNAAPMGQDLDTASKLIRQGGMMNSLSTLQPGGY